jgi:hypothetical protein
MGWRRQHKRPIRVAVDAWITQEFEVRGLAPPHCSPEALAQALESERHIAIEFRAHESDDPGVYALVYRNEGCANAYVILFRPTQSITLRRLNLFHELAHILFKHKLMDAAGIVGLRGYMVSDEDDAQAEAFAVGAMQYSFMDDTDATAPVEDSDDTSESAFGWLLKRLRNPR